MSETMSRRQPTRASAGRDESDGGQDAATAGEIMELLDAEYTQEILEAIRAEARSARELATVCGASRPTTYRRLNALVAAGLVETDMVYDADGHHRTVYEATFRRLSIDVTDDGLSVTAEQGRPA